jgi:hypothetical protein
MLCAKINFSDAGGLLKELVMPRELCGRTGFRPVFLDCKSRGISMQLRSQGEKKVKRALTPGGIFLASPSLTC